MEKIEPKKVHVLQNIILNPVQGTTPKAQLKLLYPDLKHIKTNVDIEFSNCDVYLLRIPICVDPSFLLNKEINLKQNWKLKLDKKYLIESTRDLPDTRLFVSDKSKFINLKKKFIMKRYVKTNKQPQNSVSQHSNIKLPKRLKDIPSFQDKINLSKENEKKLDIAIANIMRRKIKKKVGSIKQKLQDCHKNDVTLNVQSYSEPKIKCDVSDDTAYLDCTMNLKKKIKKNASLLINSMVTDTLQELETSYERVVETKKCKKRSKQDREDIEKNEKDVSNHTCLEDNMNTIVNSTTLGSSSISICSPNLSLIMSATSDIMAKEKKKRKSTFQEINSKTPNILEDSSSQVSVPKKVKKKKDRSLDLALI